MSCALFYVLHHGSQHNPIARHLTPILIFLRSVSLSLTCLCAHAHQESPHMAGSPDHLAAGARAYCQWHNIRWAQSKNNGCTTESLVWACWRPKGRGHWHSRGHSSCMVMSSRDCGRLWPSPSGHFSTEDNLMYCITCYAAQPDYTAFWKTDIRTASNIAKCKQELCNMRRQHGMQERWNQQGQRFLGLQAERQQLLPYLTLRVSRGSNLKGLTVAQDSNKHDSRKSLGMLFSCSA